MLMHLHLASVIRSRSMLCLFILIIGLSLFTSSCIDSGGNGGGSKKAPVTKILVIGDGISKGVGTEDRPWPGLLERQLGVPIPVGAKGGAQTAYGASQVGPLLTLNEPSHLLILLGTNDAFELTPLDTMRDQLQSMFDTAKAQDIVPVIATLPPIYGFDAKTTAHIGTINKMIRSVAGSANVKVVNLEKEFGDERALILPDGVHPSANGQALIVMAFAEALN